MTATVTDLFCGAGGSSLGAAHPADRPIGTVTTKDRYALVDPPATPLTPDQVFTRTEWLQMVNQFGFRMLEPHEVAAAMAFPDGYIPADLTKKVKVKLAGNAVCPPVMQWITGRILQALESA